MTPEKKRRVEEELKNLQEKGSSFHTADELPKDQEQAELQKEIDDAEKIGQHPLEAYKPRTDEDFDKLDKMDEEQILMELKGDMVDKFFYEFQMEGRQVVGISYAGTKQIAQVQGGFETTCVNLIEGQDEYVAYVIMKNKNKDLTMPGGASQPKVMEWIDRKTGERRSRKDDKAVAKVISKATRNAIRATIPEEFIKSLYERYKEKEKARARTDSQ